MALRVDPITGRVVADGSGGDDDSSAGAPSDDDDDEEDDDEADMAGDLDMDSDDSELDGLLAAANGDAAKAAAMLVQQRSGQPGGGATTSRRARFAVNQFFQRRRKRKTNGGSHGGAAAASAVGIAANDAALRSNPARMRNKLTFEPLRFVKNKSVPMAHACPPPLTHASVVYVAAAPGATSASAGAAAGTVIVFGGLTAAGAAADDTWLFHESSQTWELVAVPDAAPQPDGRCGHCAVVLRDAPPMVGLSASPRRTTSRVLPGGTADTYDPTMLVLFGADHLSGRRFNDVWAFRLADRSWTLLHAGGDASDGGGGRGGLGFGNESRLSNAGGAGSSGGGAEPPCARWGAVAGTYDDRVVIYGGESQRYEALGDVGMFDFATCQWRRLRRAMAPLPTPRVHSASCVVAEKLIVTGGIGPNGAECPSDVTWVLEMRTLLWRRISGEVGPAGHGPMAEHPGRYLSGHRLLPFDDLAVLVGGRVATPGRATASEAHTSVWLLDVPNEHWIALGELPSTAASLRLAAAAGQQQQQQPTETSTWPVATSFSAVCPKITYSVSSGIDASLTLEALASSGIHLTDEKEAAQYVDALQQSLQSQAAFSGVLSVRGGRPLLSHNAECLMLGGSVGAHKQPTSDAFTVRFDYELADASSPSPVTAAAA